MKDIPSTSCTLTSFQNLLFRAPGALDLASADVRIRLACLSISACFFLLSTRIRAAAARSSAAMSAMGGSGGGPVPTTGATSAGLRGVVEMEARALKAAAAQVDRLADEANGDDVAVKRRSGMRVDGFIVMVRPFVVVDVDWSYGSCSYRLQVGR